jgi:sugar O-acyltransferase (sialic acid O-acetyltransferase NeuD family)
MSDMRYAPYAGTGFQRRSATRGERVVIVGAGVVGALALEYFTYDSPYEVVAFSAERDFITSDSFCGLPVVPFDKLAVEYPPAEFHAFVAVSATALNRVRRRLYDAVKAAGYRCVSYVNSGAFVSPSVQIGENTLVAEGNSLHYMVRLGDNVMLLNGVHIGHETVVEDDCFLASHVVIAGTCRIGHGSFFGVNSTVGDHLSVAEDCFIGAGAVIISDTAPRQVYIGNPARPIGGDSLDWSVIPVNHANVTTEPDGADDSGGSVATDVLRIFREICFLPAQAPVDTTQPLTGQPGWDSLRQVEFIMRLEQRFHVRLTETDLLQTTTVGSVISTLEGKSG